MCYCGQQRVILPQRVGMECLPDWRRAPRGDKVTERALPPKVVYRVSLSLPSTLFPPCRSTAPSLAPRPPPDLAEHPATTSQPCQQCNLRQIPPGPCTFPLHCKHQSRQGGPVLFVSIPSAPPPRTG
ncbi:hypothetical protein DPEC_G00085360 [Dallia pectoralis]|uniref:Uncharacterized protein n=1 Tax=Dallia pectoralis TaxID=75939 RepID=A0ACC2GZG9_DALPE|nr:hypothetical protein DPEC_G00085360 [Dallia pectoralis]